MTAEDVVERARDLLRRRGRDALRISLQGAVAAAAAWALARFAGLDEVSWSVISALFVLQQSLDDTLKQAAGRVAAGVIGGLFGLLLVYLFPGDDLAPVRLAFAALVLGGLGTLYPSLSYAVIAGAVIALDPGGGDLATAGTLALAILLGALAGAGAAVSVWPESAQRRAVRLSRSALGACRDLLKRALEGALADEAPDLDPIHARFLEHARQARATAGASRVAGGERPAPDELVKAVLRLWHSLILLDRSVVGDEAVQLARSRVVKSAIHAVREAACAYVEALQARLDGRGDGDGLPDNDLNEALDKAARVLDHEIDEHSPQVADRALLFGLREAARDLRRIGRLLQPSR